MAPVHRRRWIEFEDRRRVTGGGLLERIDFPKRVQGTGIETVSPARKSGVHVTFRVPKSRWNDDDKDAVLPPREEVCRLSLVGAARVEPIAGPDGNIQVFLEVSVEVSERQTEGPVRVE